MDFVRILIVDSKYSMLDLRALQTIKKKLTLKK